MKGFQQAVFRGFFVWMVAGGLLAIGVGCGEAVSVEAQEQHADQEASESLPEAPSDSAREALSALDSLFLDYDHPALAWHPPDTVEAARWTDSVLAVLTLEEKIGQLFIVHLPRSDLRRMIGGEALKAVQTYGVGGFLVPRLFPPRDVFKQTQRLQQAAKVPLFFAADYERGVGRFNNALTELPSNMALGATRDTLLAAAAGRLTALESRAIGVNLLFAPVVDVNDNPANPIINIRSYGEDPELVGRMAAAFVGEAQRHGVLTTLKHFPGHGNTAVDSHTRMGRVAGDVAAIDSVEFRPFRRVLRHGAAAVMSAHLWVPAYDEQPLPATFSRRLLHDVLRDSLGFDGIVVTDDIRMGALQSRYSANERIVRSLAAGADVILTPVSLPRAIEAVKTALQRGELDETAIDRSVRRILGAKAQAGLHRQRVVDEAALASLLEKPRGAFLAQAVADAAATLLKTDPVLPLGPAQPILLVQLSNVGETESIAAAMDSLAEALGPQREVRLGQKPSQAEVEEVLDTEAGVVVLALYLRLKAGRGEAGLFPGQERFVRRLLDQDVPVVLVTFGNPYVIIPFDEAEVLLVAYEQSLASVAAVAGILRGQQPARGLLPITVGPYPFGSGVEGF